ncbi:MAG: FAD-binding oxidoreductase [Janthinobacterium lividum]
MKFLYKSRFIFFLGLFWLSISCAHALSIDDKSHLNQTQVDQIIKVPQKDHLEFLKSIIKLAKLKKIPLSLKGTQHSQGGHSFFKDAWVLDLSSLNQMQMIQNRIIRVQTGAKWKDVLDFLNDKSLSVSVMQSDYDFSIGGTLSTNVHGWQVNKQPLIHTVLGFHILLADGTYHYCSREQNSDIFKAAIGGYGLLGVIIDVDLDVVENSLYHLQQWVVETSDFQHKFLTHVIQNPKAALFFARFSCDSKNFLKNIIFNVYEKESEMSSNTTLSSHRWLHGSVNYLFSLTYQSDFFKNMRWYIESNTFLKSFYSHMSRNALMYHSVDNYIIKHEDYTDLLQEFFIPLENFDKFVRFLQSLQPDMINSLMNITVRHVRQDQESILNYAERDRLAFVMYFRGKKDADFDQKLKNLVVKITDYALALGGNYYLPYRGYQTLEQFKKSYPKAALFKQIKLKYDPQEIFINQFYDRYFKDLTF